MPNTVDIDTVGSLSVQQRLELIEKIWETFDRDSMPFTQEQRREIQRRLDHYRRHPETARTYEQIKAKLERLA